MDVSNQPHNLLIVSDMHIAAGLESEAGESCYGHEGYLYDGAFARFLRYHEQTRRDAHQQQDGPLDRPWRLILAGDIFDFWDVTRVPGDAGALRQAIDDAIRTHGMQSAAGLWLRELRRRLGAAEAGWHADKWTYTDVRSKLDALNLQDGVQRRAMEALTWWTEVLVQQRGELPRRTRRHGLGTSWQEVVWKLTHMYRGHLEFFGALAWFIACGNEVVVLKGNHDIELYWREVHDGHLPHLLVDAYVELHGGGTLSPALGEYSPELMMDLYGKPLPEPNAFRHLLVSSPDSRGARSGKRLVFKEWYYCEPDLVYIEHGNQYEPADSSVCFNQPLMPSDVERIELPWGAFLVRYFYNKVVAAHPFAVNVKPEQRIINWMIREDLFRLLGIVVAEFIDILRALVRAVKQGFRGTWIWGDHSITGLVPLLIYDLIQLNISHTKRKRRSHRDRTAQSGDRVQGRAPAGGPMAPGDNSSLWAAFQLHLGGLLTILCLLLAGAGRLFGWTWTAWIVLPLIGSGALALVGAVRSVRLGQEQGWHSLGVFLLQVGAVGAVTALIAYLALAGLLGWALISGLLAVLIPLVAAALGGWLIRRNSRPREDDLASQLYRTSWQARSLRSSASLFLELGFLGTVVGVVYLSGSAPVNLIGAWLRAALSLFVAGWATNRLHIMYVSRVWPERFVGSWFEGLQKGLRSASTVLVVLLALALIVVPMAWLANSSIQFLFPEGGSEVVTAISSFAAGVYETMTTKRILSMPILVALVLALAVVVLVETGVRRLSQRRHESWLHRRSSRPASQAKGTRTGGYPVQAIQLAEIAELARAEQRRWLGSLLGFSTVLLPFVAAVLLILAVAGGLAAVLNILSPFLETAALLTALGVSALSGFAYWLLRQISASGQRKDPQSGFGDLFYRMAVAIAGILAATERGQDGAGLGRPRYFVFGHDHWADSKPLEGSCVTAPSYERQWYVNAGSWLRGYVKEQRQEEVSENHSTFVQIIPGMDDEAAPRVLRWNDSANQPEHIVRREEPQSVSEMVWSRWEGGWLWVMVWAGLLAIVWRLVPAGWMAGLWPLVWILGLWLLSWALVAAGSKLSERAPDPGPAPDPRQAIDMHCHVGLLGDQHPKWGKMSEEYRRLPVFTVMLLFGRIDADDVSDETLRAASERAIDESLVGHVVCLALDPVYSQTGERCPEASYLWVDNDYILSLRESLGDKVLLGASVHPYDPEFEARVSNYVDRGAVLLKWLPSAQQIDLADERVGKALTFLAKARNGKALPLLLHVGPEYAIPSTDPGTASYDYLTWSWWDALKNRLRRGDKLYEPKVEAIHANLRAGLAEGAVIIFAHCGLPYYAPRRWRRFLEHSELGTVRSYLKAYPAASAAGGCCYADVSALVTPFRRSYFGAISKLPPESLLFGSDYPTPVFELSAGLGEFVEDLGAVLQGELDRILVPEDNLIDTNYLELQRAFPGHAMFTNFHDLLNEGR